VLQQYKVAVLGAAGGIGQPLSLLLKEHEAITHLSLYDIVNTPGVAADLAHINTKAKVRVFPCSSGFCSRWRRRSSRGEC
jgi:malate/lactate dehydrogenase